LTKKSLDQQRKVWRREHLGTSPEGVEQDNVGNDKADARCEKKFSKQFPREGRMENREQKKKWKKKTFSEAIAGRFLR